MNWNDQNLLPIKLSISNEIKTGWKKEKSQIAKKYNDICACCGGTYKKYTYCVQFNNSFYILCNLCYKINYCTYSISNDTMKIYWSNLNQRQIIRTC